MVRLSYGRAGEASPSAELDDPAFRRLAVQDTAVLLGVPSTKASSWLAGTGLAAVIPDALAAGADICHDALGLTSTPFRCLTERYCG